MPVSLSTCYKSCWEIWSPIFCPPGTHILPLFHLFMTALRPQTYSMSPREMEAQSHFRSAYVLSHSPHSPQEIRNTNIRTDVSTKKIRQLPSAFYFAAPLLSFSRGVIYRDGVFCVTMFSHRIAQTDTVDEPVAYCLSVLIKNPISKCQNICKHCRLFGVKQQSCSGKSKAEITHLLNCPYCCVVGT